VVSAILLILLGGCTLMAWHISHIWVWCAAIIYQKWWRQGGPLLIFLSGNVHFATQQASSHCWFFWDNCCHPRGEITINLCVDLFVSQCGNARVGWLLDGFYFFYLETFIMQSCKLVDFFFWKKIDDDTMLFNWHASYFVVLAGWLFSISFLALGWWIYGCKRYLLIFK